MTIERITQPTYINQLIRNLDEATTHLEKLNQQPQISSKQELNNLINLLNQLNETFDPKFWEEKKLAPQEINETIERALNAIQVFHRIYPNRNGLSQRHVDQAIISLVSVLDRALNTFDKNLRDLKKYKIGHRVKKTGEMKQA